MIGMQRANQQVDLSVKAAHLPMKLDEKAVRVNRTCNLVLQSLVHCIVWLITCCHISKPRIIVQGPQNVRQITATDLSGIFMKES